MSSSIKYPNRVMFKESDRQDTPFRAVVFKIGSWPRSMNSINSSALIHRSEYFKHLLLEKWGRRKWPDIKIPLGTNDAFCFLKAYMEKGAISDHDELEYNLHNTYRPQLAQEFAPLHMIAVEFHEYDLADQAIDLLQFWQFDGKYFFDEPKRITKIIKNTDKSDKLYQYTVMHHGYFCYKYAKIFQKLPFLRDEVETTVQNCRTRFLEGLNPGLRDGPQSLGRCYFHIHKKNERCYLDKGYMEDFAGDLRQRIDAMAGKKQDARVVDNRVEEKPLPAIPESYHAEQPVVVLDSPVTYDDNIISKSALNQPQPTPLPEIPGRFPSTPMIEQKQHLPETLSTSRLEKHDVQPSAEKEGPEEPSSSNLTSSLLTFRKLEATVVESAEFELFSETKLAEQNLAIKLSGNPPRTMSSAFPATPNQEAEFELTEPNKKPKLKSFKGSFQDYESDNERIDSEAFKSNNNEDNEQKCNDENESNHSDFEALKSMRSEKKNRKQSKNYELEDEASESETTKAKKEKKKQLKKNEYCPEPAESRTSKLRKKQKAKPKSSKQDSDAESDGPKHHSKSKKQKSDSDSKGPEKDEIVEVDEVKDFMVKKTEAAFKKSKSKVTFLIDEPKVQKQLEHETESAEPAEPSSSGSWKIAAGGRGSKSKGKKSK